MDSLKQQDAAALLAKHGCFPLDTPVSGALPTQGLLISGPLACFLRGGWQLRNTGWTGQVQDRETVVALLPGVVLSDHLLYKNSESLLI